MNESFVTYKRQDGEPIFGEYSFATDLDSCSMEVSDAEAPVTYIKETWQLVSWELLTLKPVGWDELQAELAEERAADPAHASFANGEPQIFPAELDVKP